MKKLVLLLSMFAFLIYSRVAVAEDDYNCIPYHDFRQGQYLYTGWSRYDTQQCEKREYYEYICDYCQEVVKGFVPLERRDHTLMLYTPHCHHIGGTELHYFIYLCERCSYDEAVTLPCPGNGYCITVMSVLPEVETE